MAAVLHKNQNKTCGAVSGPLMSDLRPLVIAGPSGSGKSTLIKKLLAHHGKWFALCVSHTTRAPRSSEVDGRDYYFVTRERMENAIAAGEFIEHTIFSGNLYGTSKRAISEVMTQNRICILDIEMQGVRNIKKTDLKPYNIFVKPPSLQVLEDRVRARNTETEESLAFRRKHAVDDLKVCDEEGLFDLIIVNDDFNAAYETLENFLVERYPMLASEVVENSSGTDK